MKKFFATFLFLGLFFNLIFTAAANAEEVFFWRGKDLSGKDRILDYYVETNSIKIHSRDYCRVTFNFYKTDDKKSGWGFTDFFKNADGEIIIPTGDASKYGGAKWKKIEYGDNFYYNLYTIAKEYVDFDEMRPCNLDDPYHSWQY